MFNVTHLIATGGLALIALIIFAESGMLVGFFFPGDTLLFSAGIFAAQGKLSIALSLIVIAGAAILGDNIGYQIGKSLGPHLFSKDSLVFRQEYIARAEQFFAKYGSKAMLIAHFVPIVRTFAPVTAGAAEMDRKTFFVFDAIGDIAWTLSVTLFGYFVGSRIPGVEKYIEPVILLVVVAALAPTLYHVLKDERMRSAITSKVMRRRTKQSDEKAE